MNKIFSTEIDLNFYEESGIIKEHFPLHDQYRHEIDVSWKKYRRKLILGFVTGNFIKYMQPLNFIANYYGEKMAFFYAWLMFYTGWLIIPAIPGIALFIYQMFEVAT